MRVIPGIIICTLILLVISCNSTSGEKSAEEESTAEVNQAQALINDMIA